MKRLWLKSLALGIVISGCGSETPSSLPDFGSYSTDSEGIDQARLLEEIKVGHITTSDLSLFRLCDVIRQRLADESVDLRIILDPSLSEDRAVSDTVVRNLFSPYFEAEGDLDSADLIDQISSNSVYDLLFNMRDMCVVSVGLFSDSICINHGDNLPLKVEFSTIYRLKFEMR